MTEEYLALLQENAQLKAEIEKLKQEKAMLSTKTKEFDEYEIVNDQINRSKIPRLNWKLVFGETLTKIVAEYYANKKTPIEAYEDIKVKLANMSITSPELLRRLKIGVCSRYGEIRSERKKIAETHNANIKNTPLWKKVNGVEP